MEKRASFYFQERKFEESMVESGLEMDDPIIDISINTGDAEADEEVEQLLEKLEVELIIKRMLQMVNAYQPVMLTLLITGDPEIQELNKQYRQQDKPTDVLSFPLLDEPLVNAPAECLWQVPEGEEDAAIKLEQVSGSKPVFVTPAELITNLGDIAISWPTAQRQASIAGHNIAYELLFLFCHGALHLVGYDDQTESGYTEMVRLQTKILATVRREV
jgi:probable rRNA maturation factor